MASYHRDKRSQACTRGDGRRWCTAVSRTERNWEHGRLRFDPYTPVSKIRIASGYHGDDCDRCPGRWACVWIWDRLCEVAHNRSEIYRTIALTRPYACGRRAMEDEELVNDGRPSRVVRNAPAWNRREEKQ